MEFSKNSIRKALRYNQYPTWYNMRGYEAATKAFHILLIAIRRSDNKLSKEQFLNLINRYDYLAAVTDSGKYVVYSVDLKEYGIKKFYSKKFLEI